jgi:hypothetical protein
MNGKLRPLKSLNAVPIVNLINGIKKRRVEGMLRSEINNKAMKRLIHNAAREKFHKMIGSVFEHGHWWIRFNDIENERIFSVVDCWNNTEGDYFDFEEV